MNLKRKQMIKIPELDIEVVHQLQNIYYWLTNKELTSKTI